MTTLNTTELRKRFREAINALTDNWPDMEIIDAYLDDECHELQDFCSTHCTYVWMTGMGVIEAAMRLVDGAAENGNINEGGRIV